MANIVIEGHGSFTLNPEKTQELMQWLETNGAVNVESTSEKSFEGKTLLNEQQPGANVGKGMTDDPGPDGKTYDLGTTWI